MTVECYFSDQLSTVLYQLIDAGELLQPKEQAEFRELLQELGAITDAVETFERFYFSVPAGE